MKPTQISQALAEAIDKDDNARTKALNTNSITDFIDSLEQQSKIAVLTTVARSLHGTILSKIRSILYQHALKLNDKEAYYQRYNTADQPRTSLDRRNAQDEADREDVLGRNADDQAAEYNGTDRPYLVTEKDVALYRNIYESVLNAVNAYSLSDYQRPQSFEAMIDNMIKSPRAMPLDEQIMKMQAERGIDPNVVAAEQEQQAKNYAKYLAGDKVAIMTIYDGLELNSEDEDPATLEDLGREELPGFLLKVITSLNKQYETQIKRAKTVEHIATGDMFKSTAEQLERWLGQFEQKPKAAVAAVKPKRTVVKGKKNATQQKAA